MMKYAGPKGGIISSAIYRISGLAYAYGNGPHVLDVPELTIEPETITSLIGPNGSGKTTFLKLLAFVEKPAQGEIRFKDRPSGPFADHARFAVTFLPQTPYLLKRSVYGNIAYGLRLRGITGDLTRRIESALALVGLPAEYARRRSEALSGGQAQRVALAARLALEPEVLLLDEPTASVDAESARLIKEAVLEARQKRGTTVVVASHDPQWMHEIPDRILQMHHGRVWEAGNRNVVNGPWKPSEDGRWEKVLPGGQRILVPPPPAPDASAVIDFALARLEAGGAGPYSLCVTVSRLILEPRRRAVAVTLTADQLTLTVRVDCPAVEQGGLLPGKTVFLSYDPDSVTFM
ncbi:MAG: energy-coupling factor ABC transporter ATP-binding protein [Thermodesulfobacteriota bacterium]